MNGRKWPSLVGAIQSLKVLLQSVVGPLVQTKVEMAIDKLRQLAYGVPTYILGTPCLLSWH